MMRKAYCAVWAALAAQAAGQTQSGFLIERFAKGFIYAEGPAWSPDGSLVVSDPPNNVIYRLKGGEKTRPLRENSNGAVGNAIDAQGRLYTCESHTRRVVREDKRGRMEVLAERWQGKRLNAPSDIAVRKDGHVYFTDPAFGSQRDARELDFYGVFHIAPGGGLELVAKPKGRPNGIALSPDGKVLYVANSDERNVRAYDLNRKGEASHERILIERIPGVPGGLRTDGEGNLWLAAKAVFEYSPDGVKIGEIPLDETPSNCAFGDADRRSLYITARTSVYRARLPEKGLAH